VTVARKQLSDYDAKRDFDRTPEPAGSAPAPQTGDGARFVVQEHHARRLHWDLRLERDGVLVSWAVPNGIPEDPGQNRKAIRTEDHPLSYIDFEGEIPRGSYGAGKVTVWDHGTYDCEKFEPDKVIVNFHGERLRGRYALFRTGRKGDPEGKDWMIHRMDPPEPGLEPMPEGLTPMLARLSERLPRDETAWGYEVKWDGVRALLYWQPGRMRIESRNRKDLTSRYPELRGLGPALGSRTAILDGEIVAFDADGRPSFERLQQRMHLASDSLIRRRAREVPVAYVVFDVLYLDGRATMPLPYEERRALLEGMGLEGPAWQVPAYHRGEGKPLLDASKEQGLEGIVAKRLTSPYEPGRRGANWLKVKNALRQEFVIGGWLPGEGRRRERIGALLVGFHDEAADGGEHGPLRYAGRVGTGFSEAELDRLARLLAPLARPDSPFELGTPPRGAVFVEPELVAEVEFREWTRDRMLRHPSYKGLREDKPAAEVVLERPAPPPGS
jgi:bifunctional non-homologous end joining protein LigD